MPPKNKKAFKEQMLSKKLKKRISQSEVSISFSPLSDREVNAIRERSE